MSKHTFDEWYLMLCEANGDFDVDAEPLSLLQFTESIQQHFRFMEDAASHLEIWYCWRVLTIPRDEETGEAMDETPRLLVPWSDPKLHEFAFDFIFETPEKARKGLETWGAEDDAAEEGWVLCRQTLEFVDDE